jgi:ABC-type multidrug transport system ATPase subunit
MIVETHGLTKSYRRVAALRGLDLRVDEGSAFALIGPNGAGKTTLLQLLVNVLQPSAGSATVLGVDSRRIAHRELARIGYVSENQQLPGRLTVGAFFDYLRPFYPSWDRAIEQDLRARMHLPADRQIRKLSHGMRMKMALACALPFKPALLVLDEPLSGLDPLARDEFMEGMLHQAGETTVVISSHEIAEIENAVTHVGYLDSGTLMFQESSNDLHARVREVRVVLDAPAAPPARVPAGWLDVRASGNVLTFVETHYSEAELGNLVRACVPGVRRIDTESLPLRSIFVALARATRNRPAAATPEAS